MKEDLDKFTAKFRDYIAEHKKLLNCDFEHVCLQCAPATGESNINILSKCVKNSRLGYKIKFIDLKTDCEKHGKDRGAISVYLPEISGRNLCVDCVAEKMTQNNLWSKYSSKE